MAFRDPMGGPRGYQARNHSYADAVFDSDAGLDSAVPRGPPAGAAYRDTFPPYGRGGRIGGFERRGGYRGRGRFGGRGDSDDFQHDGFRGRGRGFRGGRRGGAHDGWGRGHANDAPEYDFGNVFPQGFANAAQAGTNSGFEANLKAPTLAIPNWDTEKLDPFSRDLYSESSVTAQRTDEEISEWRKRNFVFTAGIGTPPKPVLTVEELQRLDTLVAALKLRSVAEVTPLQGQLWPLALGGKSVLVVAPVAAGQVEAVAIPALHHVAAQAPLQPGDGPIALVLVTTKELAIEIQDVATALGNSQQIKNTAVFGSAPADAQIRDLAKGAEILIGTPGRVLELVASAATNLMRVSFVVIEDAARMSEIGYDSAVRQILDCVRPDRQAIVLSNTISVSVHKLAAFACGVDHSRLLIDPSHDSAHLRQQFCFVQPDVRNRTLAEVLDHVFDPRRRALVLTRRQELADKVTVYLRKHGYPALVLRSSQQEQKWVLEEIERMEIHHILVATDESLARVNGVPDFTTLVNVDIPRTTSDFEQRLRKWATPLVDTWTIFTPDDASLAAEISRLLEDAALKVPRQLAQYCRDPDVAERTPKRGGSRNRSPQHRKPRASSTDEKRPREDTRKRSRSKGRSREASRSRDRRRRR
eukprot:TRINITY_DN12581_c0_g1_i1.p1 TRINITY_DN12581_c0_g1~~TRINITY_DN12581_c0_g1_i1.p1  ORF type:complete len:642 (+),score=73.04 TRINITY_DN12581_c0_g1_i1:47-1972(+)